jgi:hypothetical protein
MRGSSFPDKGQSVFGSDSLHDECCGRRVCSGDTVLRHGCCDGNGRGPAWGTGHDPFRTAPACDRPPRQSEPDEVKANDFSETELLPSPLQQLNEALKQLEPEC